MESFPNDPKWSKIVLNGCKLSQIFQNGPKWSQMVSNVLKILKLFQKACISIVICSTSLFLFINVTQTI